MYGPDACTVENLLTAGSAWSGHEEWRFQVLRLEFRAISPPDSGEEYHFANGQGSLVVFLLIAKRTGHAAAAAGDDMHLGPSQQRA